VLHLKLEPKEGFNASEKLVLKGITENKLGRRQLHREFQLIEQYLAPVTSEESYAEVADRLGNALALKQLSA
jgi:hypothetical protein